MATDSNRFPLQNSIRKVLDDPNSRPKLPGLDEGSVVGDDKFGEADHYDSGTWSDIAVNNGNVVLEVHESEDSLWYRLGQVDGKNITWGNDDRSTKYDSGESPSAAMTNDGLVVEVHQSQGLSNALWYRLGQVEGNKIDWRNDGKSIEYDSGQDPSVAINNNGLVIEVHKSANIIGTNDKLWYRLGQVNGDIIDWRNDGKSIEYDSGLLPSVGITDDGLVVEAHSSSGQLLYRLGNVEDNIINWRNTDKRHYANGSFPSVAITSDGLVVAVNSFNTVPLPTNPSPPITLWHHRGQVKGDTIDWVNKGIEYNKGGGIPRVACNERLAVETHKEEKDKLLCSVLTLPAFRGKWIALEGDNSYCYCACNSATDNKDRHVSSHTMNVKAGAPYFYAVLTKDDDSIDFPTGAILTIEGPDGTKYDRDIQEENQLAIMSGSSVRCLIVKDPKPGDWKMTMTVPEGVGFHCECNTVPSKDVYDTITETLDNSLQKRGLDDSIAGWLGSTGLGAILIPDLPGMPSPLEPLYMADVYDATSYVAVGESGDTEKVELSKAEQIGLGKALGQYTNSNVKEGGVKKASQKVKNIAKTATKKKKKGVKRYVYAVAYDQRGNFLMAEKPTLAYFFHQGSGGGIIFSAGKRPHGSGKYALPGGELDAGSPIAGAIKEFTEETNVTLGSDYNYNIMIDPFEGKEPPGGAEPRFIYYGVYFDVGDQLSQLVDRVRANLDSGRRAAEAVRRGNYDAGDYHRLRADFSGCPQDNELEDAQLWNLNDQWDTIHQFQDDNDLNWFYYILNNLRNQLGTRVSSLQQFADR